MYAAFYGFRSEPFHVTPDASLLFLTQAHREAIGVLEYGLRVRKGFIVITGEVGVGKTTVLRHSLRRLDPASSAIVYVLQPALTPHQLLAFIWEELSGETDPIHQPWMADTGELIRHLLFCLKELHTAGKLIVIVIDEAQNMPVETLEMLRLLSNLENDKQKFLQIVLAGQPELEEKLARYELRQLNQRIAVRTRIGNLSPQEARGYVEFRIDRAAGRRGQIFTDDALAYLIARSGGNPRRLNIFCDNALINGMGHRASVITREIAAEAVAPFLGREEEEPFRPASSHVMPAWMSAITRSENFGRNAWAGAIAVLGIGLFLSFGPHIFSAGPAARPLVAELRPAPVQLAALPRDDETLPDIMPDPEASTAMPAPATLRAPIAKANPPPVPTYKVETQETLAQLCLLTYGECGDGVLHGLIGANPTVDPNHLIAGQIVYLPTIGALTPVVP